MRPILLVAASALALTASACGPKPIEPRAALDCPTREGDLRRTTVAGDGRSCTYVSSEGAEVTLQLVSVQGGPDVTLRALEDSLLAPQPAAAAASGETPAEAPAPAAQPAPAASGASRDAAAVEREARADASATVTVKVDGGGDDEVVIRDGPNERVKVDLPGIHVEADESNESAKVRIGPLHVDAGGDGAVVRMQRDVRLRGDQLVPDKRGVRATFLAEGPRVPAPYHFVGYEAGGPKVGPLTVAVVKSTSEIDQGGRVHNAVKRLVRRNGGV